jgi:hypothetical protein
MANELSRLLQDVAEMQRRQAGGVHQGTVDEVKGDKIRVAWGKDPDGKPVLSPWLDTSNHRGGARERRFYKKGQNVTIDTVNGEMDEAATDVGRVAVALMPLPAGLPGRRLARILEAQHAAQPGAQRMAALGVCLHRLQNARAGDPAGHHLADASAAMPAKRAGHRGRCAANA